MEHWNGYPFAAIVGQDEAKRAVLIALVNPEAGGLLVSGCKGTAKTTLVRGAAELAAPCRLVNVPLNVTEDMLFGTIDLEYAVQEGKRRFEPGLLARCDGNILYIDEANLLRQELLTSVLAARLNGCNHVERDGFSYTHATDFVLLATMNPEEGTLPQHILDRFGLYVDVQNVTERSGRVEIMHRCLAYEQDKAAFRAAYAGATETLRRQVQQARALLPSVQVSETMMALSAEMCGRALCAGHRADLYLLEAARSLAALAGRNYVLPKDVEEAAVFVLPHRMRQLPPKVPRESEEPPPENETSAEEENGKEQEQPQEEDESPDSPGEEQPHDGADTPGMAESPEGAENGEEQTNGTSETPQPPSEGDGMAPEERISGIGRNFPMPALELEAWADHLIRRGSGKRSLTRTDLKQGRYVRAALVSGKTDDIAFDATLRAAAPYQRFRKKDGKALSIYVEDIRQKVREKRIGTTFLFDVDASGSMGARERMTAVKGAIFQLLEEAYQKRDRVGMIAFRRDKADLLLPVTRSIELAKKCLETLPTGGRTPLPQALEKALMTLELERRKDKHLDAVLILVTDGRTNRAGKDGDPVAEALALGAKIRQARIPSVVIDTEQDFVKLGIARELAAAMGAAYYTLKGLTQEKIIRVVRNR